MVGDLHRHLAELRRHHRERGADAVAQVHRLDVDVALAGVGLELPGDAAHPVDQVVDALERGERLLRPPPGQQQPRAGEIGLHRRQRLVQLVADRGRHLAERGELRRLLEALLGLLEVHLDALSRADLRGEPAVQHAQLLGLALDAPALGAGAPRQQVEGEGEQQRQHHDDQRQDRVHPGADVLERGEVGQPPVAEADRHLGAADAACRRCRRRRARRSCARPRGSPGGPARGRGRGRAGWTSVFCRQFGSEASSTWSSLSVTTTLTRARRQPSSCSAEIDGDHDDAEQLVVLHDAAGVVEAVGAVVVLDDREDGAGVGLGGGEIGLVAVVLLARALVAGGDDAALGVEQEDRAGADLLLEALRAAPRRRRIRPSAAPGSGSGRARAGAAPPNGAASSTGSSRRRAWRAPSRRRSGPR